MRAVSTFLVAALVTMTTAGAAKPAPPGIDPVRTAATVAVQRGGPPLVMPVMVGRAGEAALDVVASAPGISWATPGRESAVVSIDVDGRYVTDLVVASARRTPRSLGLGHLSRGPHKLRFRFAADRSPAGGHRVDLRDLRLTVAAAGSPAQLVRRHAPVLLGRALASPFENAVTDTPQLAWHETQDAPNGRRRILYSVIWSNEDGGTDSPALMARWGRSTDIEWIYAVDVDANGNRTAPAIYHGPGHSQLPFTGVYEGDHPVLQTCTVNNTVCDQGASPMRFALGVDQTRPARRAREYLMDVNPWTYPMMAEELEREGKVESPSDPDTPAVGDQRTYLYLEVDKDTARATGPAPGLSVLVRLADGRVYRSDHGRPSWAIARDDPAATTVELPAGAVPAEVLVERVPAAGDNLAAVTVSDVNRAFFLDANRLPQGSLIAVHDLNVQVTAAAPVATVWRASQRL
jgi:hypothetical protein